ncbi:MAG TPA: hypothetical protein VFD57_01375 [Clostridia bacterium]|nr:hypothetical protein [Clostridia bacterium]
MLQLISNATVKTIMAKASNESAIATETFNVPHSGNWGVCVEANNPVGMDIERIKAVDFNIAKRFFTKKEYRNLMD